MLEAYISYLIVTFFKSLDCLLAKEMHPDLPPISQSTIINKIEAQYRDLGHIRVVPRQRETTVGEDSRLNCSRKSGDSNPANGP
jgi:hypothetical protein